MKTRRFASARNGAARLSHASACPTVSFASLRWIALPVSVFVLFAHVGCGGLEERSAEFATQETPEPWLVEVTSASGLAFVHETGATGDRQMPEIIGPGCAMFDFDNDGDLDIYLVNGAFKQDSNTGEEAPRNQLFRHDDGLQFTNVTAGSGLGDQGYGMGVAIGDIDNDGWTDVFVTNDGPDQLYRNRGDGTFENITLAAGINVPGWSCSAAFLDYDRDGYLDLYVTQYVQYRASLRCTDMAGRPDYCGPKSFPPAPDVLLHNNGDGTFSDVSKASGILDSAAGAGLGVVCADFNNDSWIDIYVANDGYANNLWLNKHDGTFVDIANTWGCALNAQGQREAGMGVVAEDLDGDQALDLFITHLSNETNTFYRMVSADHGMSDATGSSGLGPSSMAMTGFGAVAMDLDLDGALDLLVANGRVARMAALNGAGPAPPWDTYAEPNLVYRNLGDGRFEQMRSHVDDFTNPIEISRGLCTGDVDQDGRVDVLLTNTAGDARLYLNQTPARGHWITVRAIDPRFKREAIGAVIKVESENRAWTRSVHRNDSYLSASDPAAHFGLGNAESADRITVTWPDGLVESFTPACVDCVVTLNRGQGKS